MNNVKLHIVIQSRGQWWVDVEGKGYGPFPTSLEAARGAVALAHLFDDPDRPADVQARGSDGRYHSIWSSRTDPFPPNPSAFSELASDCG